MLLRACRGREWHNKHSVSFRCVSAVKLCVYGARLPISSGMQFERLLLKVVLLGACRGREWCKLCSHIVSFRCWCAWSSCVLDRRVCDTLCVRLCKCCALEHKCMSSFPSAAAREVSVRVVAHQLQCMRRDVGWMKVIRLGSCSGPRTPRALHRLKHNRNERVQGRN